MWMEDRVGDWFQSTRPRGARHVASLFDALRIKFQSTRPRGARHAAFGYFVTHSEFQSTRPRGARLFAANKLQILTFFLVNRESVYFGFAILNFQRTIYDN